VSERAVVSDTTAQAILDDLIRQQRLLRSRGADHYLLDANRLGIIYWQGQVARRRRATDPRGSGLSTESTDSTATRHQPPEPS
jgi:hypothetical protein